MACFIGTLAAVPGSGTLRAIRMPASNPTVRADERFYLAAVRAGLVRYARAGERCVSLTLHGTAQPARARFW